MKKLWKKLFTRTYSQNNKFELLLINDEAEIIYQKLGISEERSDELIEIMKKAYHNHDKKLSAIQEMLLECKHINEVIVILGFFNNYIKQQNENPLDGIINAILSSRKK